MLIIEHLKKRFGQQVVLDDINVEVHKGEILCIIGQSGGGKSVILRHIIGLILPDGGRITFNGEEICSPTTKPQELIRTRHHFGMLFQQSALFDSKTVGENICFPLRERTTLSEHEIYATMVDALEKVGLQEAFQHKMPSELSGGMKSRVGLARALVMKPAVMLYDEPTSALDPIMTDKINDLILSLRDKLSMTSIVVTHDMASAYKIADQIAMLYEGKVIFYGTPAEIRASRNPYIQQFIRGQRKLHYAVEDENTYLKQFNVTEIRQKLMSDRRLGITHAAAPATLDADTGLPLREPFYAACVDELKNAAAGGYTVALVLCRIGSLDGLKLTLGDDFCKKIIAEVGRRFLTTIRGNDLAARFDSDTIALMLTKVDGETIVRGVDRMRSESCEQPFTSPAGQDLSLIISCGVAISGKHGATAEVLIENATSALDRASAHDGGKTVSA